MSEPKPVMVVSADWHLRNNAWTDRPEISGDSMCSLSQIVALTRSLGDHVFLIGAGDLFDESDPGPSVLGECFDILGGKYSGLKPINVAHIKGNHDKTDEAHGWMRVYNYGLGCHLHKDTMYVMHRPPNHSRAFKMSGLDWTRSSVLPAAVADLAEREPDVIVVHQAWAELSGPQMRNDGSLEWLSSQVPSAKMIITGDRHLHGCIVLKNKVVVLSPGSINLQSIDEPNRKYVYIVYEDMSYASHMIRTRPVIYWNAETREELDNLLKSPSLDKDLKSFYMDQLQYPEEIRTPILSFKISPELIDQTDRIRNALHAVNAHLFIRCKTKSKPDSKDSDETDNGKPVEVVSGLISKLHNKFPDNSYERLICESLLEPQTPSERMRRLLELEYQFTQTGK